MKFSKCRAQVGFDVSVTASIDWANWIACALMIFALKDRFVFTLWVDGHGIIRHSLDNGRGGSSQSVSNLQLKEIVPKKGVPGWQVEAIAAAGSGLYDVEEIR